jgi:uroporphyrinogen-III synthase
MVQKTPNLKGKVVALTRPRGQAEEAGKLITEMGGVPYYIPALEIKGLSNLGAVKKFINELLMNQVDYVILMSTNGVKYLFEAATDLKLTNELKQGLAKTFMIAVGPRTADALKKIQIKVDMVPTKYSSEGLLEYLQNKPLSGKKIRIPRTSNATPILTDKLREMGAQVEEIYVYESGVPLDENLKNRFYIDLADGKIDAIVFGSGLSAKNIFTMLTEKAPIDQIISIIEKVTTVAIGPTTAQALEELKIKVDVTPQDYLFVNSLVALAEFWEFNKS